MTFACQSLMTMSQVHKVDCGHTGNQRIRGSESSCNPIQSVRIVRDSRETGKRERKRCMGAQVQEGKESSRRAALTLNQESRYARYRMVKLTSGTL